jgi:rhodanese-related sulfurtransferase
MNALKSALLLGILVVSIALVPVLASAEEFDLTTNQSAMTASRFNFSPIQYGIIANAANRYFSASFNYLPRPNVYRYVSWSAINPSDYYIVDARQTNMIGTAKGYCDGHLPTAHSVPFQFSARFENLFQLPRDNSKILVICYSGVSAAEVSTVLNLLGYDSYALNGGNPSVPPEMLVTGGDACGCSGDTPVWNGTECSACPAGTTWNGGQCL